MQADRARSRALRAMLGVALQATHDHLFEVPRDLRSEVTQRDWLFRQLWITALEFFGVVDALRKRLGRSERFVQGGAQAIQIGSRCQGLTSTLFRRHIRPSADAAIEAEVRPLTRKTEIEQARGVAHGHVGRLHVEMQYSFGVHVLKSRK